MFFSNYRWFFSNSFSIGYMTIKIQTFQIPTIQILIKIINILYFKNKYIFLKIKEYVCWSYQYLQVIFYFYKTLIFSLKTGKISFKVYLFDYNLNNKEKNKIYKKKKINKTNYIAFIFFKNI